MSDINIQGNEEAVKFQFGYDKNAETILVTNKKLIPIARGLKRILVEELNIEEKKDLLEKYSLEFQEYLDKGRVLVKDMSLQERVILHFIDTLIEAVIYNPPTPEKKEHEPTTLH